MASALILTRDGIIGSEAMVPSAGPDAPLDDPARLDTFEAPWRAAAIDAELLSGVAYDTEAPATARALQRLATRRRGLAGARYGLLCALERPSNAQLAEQIDLVRGYAELRLDRMAEIAPQTVDILSFFAAVDDLRPARLRWTLEALATALRFVVAVEHRLKAALGVPRPILFSPKVQPCVPTPGHGSLPSGHATEAYAVATLLTLLSGGDPQADVKGLSQRYRLAARIAVNRTVAGLHFPVDSAAGAALGVTLALHLHARGTGGVVAPAIFSGPAHGPVDFHQRACAEMFKGRAPGEGGAPCLRFEAPAKPAPEPLWGWLWGRARAEWGRAWA